MQLALDQSVSLPVLRPYQQIACEQVEDNWDSGLTRGILVLPAGGGKTECAKWLARNFQRVVAVAQTRALIAQTRRRLECEAITVQGLRAIQRGGGTWPNGAPDLLIWDEIHHGDSPDWQAIFEMVPKATRVLGLTATPWRFTHGVSVESKKKNERFGKGLGDLFDFMVVGVKPGELVRDKYLVPLEVIDVVGAEDAAAIKIGGLGPSYDREEHKHTGRIKADSEQRLCAYSAWRQYARGLRTVVYSHLVASAEQTLARFQAAGVPSDIVHGKIDPRVCEQRLQAFARGELTVLINCMQLTEGIDVPSIECITLDRGCQSLNTYIQICSRAARPSPGKERGLILDLTGASSEHGNPQKDQDYWVVTAERRNVSEMACTVCKTKVSPMFPTRCMRCDPFLPKVGARREILDTGARIFSRLKDAMVDVHDDEARDAKAVEAMSAALALGDLTEEERRLAQAELDAASKSITRRAEKAERARVEAEMAVQIAQQRAEHAARIDEAREKQRAAAAAKLEADLANVQDLVAALRPNVDWAIYKGWGVSWAVRKTRDEKWPGRFNRESYDIPAELRAALRKLDELATGQLQQKELERMLKDERTAKFGRAWCKRKVNQLFGF